MKISISALSIAYGLTPEALRYYEEKGLLSPDRTASSGFRRFSIADVQRLGIIKSLQRQGFSLDEIKRIMTHCPLAELVTMMDEKRAALREQIAQQNAVYERMTCGTDLLRDCDRLSMQPRLCAHRFRFRLRAVGFRAQTADSESPDRRAPADQLLHDHPASSADRRKRRRARGHRRSG